MNNNDLTSILKWRKTQKRQLRLLGVVVATLLLSIPVTTMIVRAGARGGVFVTLVRQLAIFIGYSPIITFSIGVVMGILAILWIDISRRIQAILLTTATITGIFTLQISGNIQLHIISIIDIIFFVVGGISGLLISGGKDIFDLDSPRELEKTSSRVSWIVFIIVFLSFIEGHLDYPNPIQATETGLTFVSVNITEVGIHFQNLIPNLVISVLFVYFIHSFLHLEREEDVVVVGPRGSGKTTLVLGLYWKARQEQDKWPTNPEESLQEIAMRFTQRGEWPSATDPTEFSHYSFHYWKGDLWKTHIKIRINDYAGEHLNNLVDVLSGESEVNETARLGGFRQNISESLTNQVLMADTLLLLLDVHSVVESEDHPYANPEEYINDYLKLIRNVEDKRIMIIATKSDFLLDEFKEYTTSSDFEYDVFYEYVNQRLNDDLSVPNLQELKSYSEADIHPLFYKTEINNEEEYRKPKVPIETVGFKELLEKL